MPFLLSSIRWCIEILSSFDCETAAQMLSCVFVFCFCSLYCFITPKGCHSYLQNRHCEIELVTFAGVAACVMHSGTRWWLRVGKSEVINVGCRHLCFTWSAAHITYLCLSCATVAAGGWSGSEISPRSVVLCAVWVIRSRIRNIYMRLAYSSCCLAVGSPGWQVRWSRDYLPCYSSWTALDALGSSVPAYQTYAILLTFVSQKYQLSQVIFTVYLCVFSVVI